MRSKHKAMTDYFAPIIETLTGEPLEFNFSSDSAEGVAFMTAFSDKVQKRYVNGDAIKAYGFQIIWTKSYSTNADDLNLEAMEFAQSFMDLIDGKNKEGNFPNFPDNCTVQKIETLQNMPNLSEVNVQESLARYVIPGQVIYFEKE